MLRATLGKLPFTRLGLGQSIGNVRCLSQDRLLTLNSLTNIEGSMKKRRRWGRGVGSGRGKMSGNGHQKSRSTPRAFEGGQTPLYKRLPKIGFHNPNAKEYQEVNLEKIQEYVEKGKLVPANDKMLNMRDLVLAGIINNPKDGVKLLAKGKETFKIPIHLEVSRASTEAVKTIEAAGGTVTCVHFNDLALRALIKPYKFDLLPLRARPTPKLMQYYLNKDKSGYLSPEIQIRNMKLFGYVTSETMLREEHDNFMTYKRKQWEAERLKKIELLKLQDSSSA